MARRSRSALRYSVLAACVVAAGRRWQPNGRDAFACPGTRGPGFGAGLARHPRALQEHVASLRRCSGSPGGGGGSATVDPHGNSLWDRISGSAGFVAGKAADAWGTVAAGVCWWGDGCRIAWNTSVGFLGGAAQGSASAMWGAVLSSEGQVIYNLFRRQLSVFVPNFEPSQQIQGDIFMQRSFWLRNLSVDPGAVSVVLALAPPGVNFTSFWVSDVRVSWKSLLELDESPIVVDIDSVRATAGEHPVGSDEEIDALVTEWLSVSGGEQAFPFEGRYPLLDGATFRVRRIQVNVSSPTRYGDVLINLRGVEARAVDTEGKQRDLRTLCELGAHGEQNGGELVTFSRLYECSQASARYIGQDRGLDIVVDEDAVQTEQFLLAPTPVAAQMTQTKVVADMRRAVSQRWKLSFPGQTSLLTLPPLLSPAPSPPPPDPRLFPFEAPPTEWQICFASGDPFDWIFSSWRMQPTKTKYAAAAGMGVGFVIAALCVALFAAAALRPREWLQNLLAKGPRLIGWLLGRLF